MMRLVALLAGLMVSGMLFVGAAHGQQESLLIGPGDLVAVAVFDGSDFNQQGRITDAGELSLRFVGDLKLAGLTPEQAALVVKGALLREQLFVAPQVTVTIEQYATQNVSVLGQVRLPGSYPIATGRSVIDLLAMAGGLTDLADRRITVERRVGHKVIPYYLSNAPTKALDTQVMVFPGDKVIVPRVEIVYVLGDVARPGGFPKATNDSRLTALEALSLAGGTPPNAVPSHARLIRKHADGTYEEIHLPLSDMQKGKKPDIPLEADDIIYVPFSYARNVAVGMGGLIAAAGSASIYHF